MASREVKNKKQRQYRLANGNACTRKYEKTINGFLMRAYRNMKSRVLGLVKPHLYKGLDILDRDTFYTWSRNDKSFVKLYRQWVESGYDRKLSPSVNRIDPRRGYTLDNIEWLSHSVNSSLGSQSRRNHSAQWRCIERLAACN